MLFAHFATKLRRGNDAILPDQTGIRMQVDLAIRRQSSGKRSLDDVMRTLASEGHSTETRFSVGELARLADRSTGTQAFSHAIDAHVTHRMPVRSAELVSALEAPMPCAQTHCAHGCIGDGLASIEYTASHEHYGSPRIPRRSLSRRRVWSLVCARCMARRTSEALMESTRLALRPCLDHSVRLHRNRRLPNLASPHNGPSTREGTTASADSLGPPARPQRRLELPLFWRKTPRHRPARNLRNARCDHHVHRDRPQGRPHRRTPLHALCRLGILRHPAKRRPMATEPRALMIARARWTRRLRHSDA
jgi:hypothetical protein